jgi:hypothetical protein
MEDEYQAGSTGILKVRYMPKEGVGTTVERITVTTTDPKAPSVELRLLVYAPLTYRIDPKFAFWDIGADPVARDINFIDLTGKGRKPAGIYSTSSNFTATLIPPEGKGSRYIIRIKPVSTKEARGGHVYIDVDMGDGTIEKRKILAAIRDPEEMKIKMDTE